MPNIDIDSPYRFFFFSNEGPRVHVHVEKADGYAKIWLDTFEIAISTGFNKSELNKLVKIAKENREIIERKWNEHFSD